MDEVTPPHIPEDIMPKLHFTVRHLKATVRQKVIAIHVWVC